MHKNAWMFKVSDLKTGEKVDQVCFYGVDSEEAWVNCIEWAEHHYNRDCHAEIIGDVILRNEDKRNENLYFQADLDDFVSNPKKVKINIMSIRKAGVNKNG